MSALNHFRLLRADARTEIHDLTLDSRTAGEGSLFLALHGAREDGADYAKEAAARGAVCVVTEHAAEGVPCVLVPDAHEAAAKLAARWYGDPAGRMTVVGVTGTNGKTTTTYLLKQLLERCLGAKVGLIGTNQNMIGDAVLPAERTTPDALTLQRLLREMAEADAKMIEKYKEAIKKEDQVSESEYERRLTVCKTCELLNAGTCGACGCYVELRAAAAVSKCPYKKW